MGYRDDLDALELRRDDLAQRLARARDGKRAAETLAREERALARELADANAALRGARVRRALPVLKLTVASPCSARWEDMAGDERVRFCAQCAKHVYDLSAMTAHEAAEIITRTEGAPCVRFYSRSDGTVMTRDCAEAARRARRRSLAAVAAGGIAALAVVGAFQGRPAPDVYVPMMGSVSMPEPTSPPQEASAPLVMGTAVAVPEVPPAENRPKPKMGPHSKIGPNPKSVPAKR